MTELRIVRSRRKTLALQVLPTGEIVARAPLRLPERDIHAFAEQHAAWLEAAVARARAGSRAAQRAGILSETELQRLRTAARADLTERVTRLAARMGVDFAGITIRAQRTRWGSCSARGSLSFNCLLMLAPPEVREHYAVDLTFYYRILGDATVGGTRPVTITGLAVFTKRVALYGGRGKAKTFSSTDALPTPDGLLQDRLPVGVVEALDPMILASKVREVCDCCRCETELTEIPPAIAEALGEELVLTGGTRRLYVTVGQFSTVRLERGAQLAVQSGGYCMPTRECCDDEGCEEDPCELFSRVDFPVRAFYPEGSDCGGTSCCGSCGK